MENETEIDSVEYVSKSQLKRESHAIQDLGRRLAALPAEHLARIPLDPPVLEAIALAQRIRNKRSALKRQYQFLGKLLRARDTAPIIAALAEIEREGEKSTRQHHRAEHWRDRILDQGSDAIDAFVETAPLANRQKLRQLWRNHHQAASDGKRIQHSRQLYREIRQALAE